MLNRDNLSLMNEWPCKTYNLYVLAHQATDFTAPQTCRSVHRVRSGRVTSTSALVTVQEYPLLPISAGAPGSVVLPVQVLGPDAPYLVSLVVHASDNTYFIVALVVFIWQKQWSYVLKKQRIDLVFPEGVAIPKGVGRGRRSIIRQILFPKTAWK